MDVDHTRISNGGAVVYAFISAIAFWLIVLTALFLHWT